jgi:hypothetical protein
MYLYERYPQDLRYTSYIHTQYAGDGNWKVYFPVAAQTGGISEGRANEICAATPDGENFKFTYDGATYTAEKRTIQGEYFEYWVKYKNEDIQVRVDTTITHRKTLPTVYISKFSYQDGDPMLSSPVICRWGEVILNRAEAYAKLGQDAKALEDVNVIRTRAGIPTEGMFAADKMHCYTSALDVVLDERRLELAFEGHRLFDLIRNEKKIDRKFPGAQPWEIVEPIDNRLQYPIPNSEWSVSGIEQNPGY